MSGLVSRSEPLMGTIVTIATVGEHGDAVTQAFEWFREVEARCSRFKSDSELSRLSATVNQAVPVSELVFESLRFALHVSEASGGALNPIVGGATFRDVSIDQRAKTVTLLRPLQLDLGAVAKGLAVDLAARELDPVQNFSIDAGGDLYLGGKNDDGDDWVVGIRHPRKDHAIIEVVRVTNVAVCTSGDYERGQHILEPATQTPASSLASATVIAPTAMLADAASTAAFVMGPAEGIAFCRRIGVTAILYTPDLERHASHD